MWAGDFFGTSRDRRLMSRAHDLPLVLQSTANMILLQWTVDMFGSALQVEPERIEKGRIESV